MTKFITNTCCTTLSVSFDAFLMQHGLSIYDAELAPIHGSTCIAYITHSETAKKTEALHKLEELEVSGGFDGIGVYQDFAKRTARDARRV